MQPSPPNPDHEQSGVQQDISDGSSNHGLMQGADVGRDSNQISGDGNRISQSQNTQNFFITLGTHWMLASLIVTGSFLGGIVFLTHKSSTLPKVEKIASVIDADKCESLPRNPNILRIAIADFDEDGSNLKMEARILKALNSQKPPGVEVCRTTQIFTDDTQAKSQGDKLGAAIVIWGQKDGSALEVFVETMKLNVPYLTNLPVPLTKASDFELQTNDLPQVVNVMTSFKLSRIYKEEGRIKDAIDTLHKALDIAERKNLNRTDTNIVRVLSDSYYYLGRLYDSGQEQDCNNINNCENAIAEYKSALSWDRTHYGALKNQGLLYEKLGKLPEAVDVYTKLIEDRSKSQSSLEIRANRAHIYLKQDQPLKAVEDLKIICQQDPRNPHYHRSLGLAQLIAQDIDGATKTYKTLINELSKDKDEKDKILNDLRYLAKKKKDLSPVINNLINTFK